MKVPMDLLGFILLYKVIDRIENRIFYIFCIYLLTILNIHVLYVQNVYTMLISVSSAFWLIALYCACHRMDTFLGKSMRY